MNRPKLVDLYCCQGGAGMGYYRAGFDVYGIDIDPQPRYPFAFHQGDVITALATLLTGGALDFHHRDGRVEWLTLADIAAVHASPPCQAYTTMSNRWRGQGGTADHWPELISPTRAALTATGRPWVLENVTGARKHMHSPLTLTGGMFGLRVHRPRLFESSEFLFATGPVAVLDPVGVYGHRPDGRRLWQRSDGTWQNAAVSEVEASAALGGVDWMDWRGMAECVPPAYTEHIGEQLLEVLESRSVAA